MSRAAIRLGFVTARSATYEGDAVRTDPGLGRLIDALAARVEGLEVATSRAARRGSLHDHALAVPSSRIHALPVMPNVIRGFAKIPGALQGIRAVEDASDVVVVQLPFAAPLALVGARRPRVYHVCADVEEIVRSTGHYHGAAGILANGLAHGIHLLETSLIASSPNRAVTHGMDLFHRLGVARGRAVVSSTLIADEIGSVRRTRPASAPFRVLFVGYVRPEKGFDVLLEALERASADIPDIELEIVGAEAAASASTETTLGARLDALGARIVVRRRPAIPFGPELFQSFADADVLALTSRSEGTPRVLVEARAFGCIPVASRVGGIPTSVTDGEDGVLFPAGDAAALARALVALAREPERRARMRDAGLRRVREMTVDALADALVDEALAALGRRPRPRDDASEDGRGSASIADAPERGRARGGDAVRGAREDDPPFQDRHTEELR